MRLLSIGNSFSEDAAYYLSQVAAAGNKSLTHVNLIIGGCTLEHHIDAFNNGELYIREENGIFTDRRVSLKETLEENDWDVITVQQSSGLSGIAASYEPWGSKLIDIIRRICPNSKIFFHKTWAYSSSEPWVYEMDWMNAQQTPYLDTVDWPSDNVYFHSQMYMFGAISGAVMSFCGKHRLPVIPSGDVIQYLRSGTEFDDSVCDLTRDNFHMDIIYGRYALAMTWYKTLFGGPLPAWSVKPEDITGEYSVPVFEFDEAKAAEIRAAVDTVVNRGL